MTTWRCQSVEKCMKWSLVPLTLHQQHRQMFLTGKFFLLALMIVLMIEVLGGVSFQFAQGQADYTSYEEQ